MNTSAKICSVALALSLAGTPTGLASATSVQQPAAPVRSLPGLNIQHQPELVDPSVLDAPIVYLVDKSGIVGETTGLNSSLPQQISTFASVGCPFRNATFVTLSWVQTIDGCGIIGISSTARWVYEWHTNPDGELSADACMEGRGYYNTNGSIVRWYPSGCGSSGSVSALIGNRATVAKMRGHILFAASIAYVNWR